ncbi:hypothetical protein HDK90DRAFT_488454 [Phyllosticta capitalensis]|uniref:Secreted protein n=1 Tax=Phyllosticta capitalensis TaxID=121624 RepID=A0ABR1YNH7_9PEZI
MIRHFAGGFLPLTALLSSLSPPWSVALRDITIKPRGRHSNPASIDNADGLQYSSLRHNHNMLHLTPNIAKSTSLLAPSTQK